MSYSRLVNLCAGGMFFGFGVFAIWFSQNYRAGTAANMGPGYFPHMLGIALVAIGLAVALSSGLPEDAGVRRLRLRPALAVVLSVLFFALGLQRLGLAATSFLTVLGCALASQTIRWRESLALAVGLTLMVVVVFAEMLGLPFPLWPA
jgi:hypothetical protein